MKPFTKRLALVMGLLFTALICLGVVFIDTTSVFWQTQSGVVKLWVSNTVPVILVDTNTQRIGFWSTNTTVALLVRPRTPPQRTNDLFGEDSSILGSVRIEAAPGGNSTTNAPVALGGNGGNYSVFAGAGGSALFATNDSIGGDGGQYNVVAGAGGAANSSTATNSVTGGNGGGYTANSGAGGAPSFAATNNVGGNGGSFGMQAGSGGSPTAGWSRKGGNGGSFTLSAGGGAAATRTNSGNGGSVSINAGGSGTVATTPGNAGTPGNVSMTAGGSGSAAAGGNPSPGGTVNITAGAGSTGTTNSNGGHVFIAGGAPGSGAVPGNVVLARTSAGLSRGAGVQIGPLIVGGSATITNALGGVATLDFPSTAAGTVSDLPVTVTGVTSNNCAVSLSVPWQVLTANGGLFTTYNSNDTIYVRFVNNNLVTAIDPTPGDFTVIGFRIR